MSLAAEVEAIRTTVALSRLDHVTALRVGGPDTFALLDAVIPAALFLRESQMRHTLLLGPEGQPVADVYVCYDDPDFILLGEGLSPAALRAYLEAQRAERARSSSVTLDDLNASHALFGLNGPYAWELAAAVLGPEINGVPYLSFLRIGDVLCFRGGKTGEYGYDLLVPNDEAPALWARLLDAGESLGVREAGLAALDQCALENWHFSMRLLEGADADQPLTPLELQLQWRVSYEKDFVGAEALRARRGSGARGRATCFTAASPVVSGQRVIYDARDIGAVLATTESCTRGDAVGVALLDTVLAHPGIDRFVVDMPTGPVPIVTRTPPLINNRSLYVDPNRHSGRTREQDSFPPLVLR